MWGVIPAAGAGSRIQPLAFSKELLPVGSRLEGNNERPRAVSEYLIERMILGGATKICFVISPGKSDILEYYGAGLGSADFSYVVQPKPAGLCDALFQSIPLIHDDEPILFGLPDTIWFPETGFTALPENDFSFMLFSVRQPEFFDAVVFDRHERVQKIEVKQKDASSNWIWGAFKMRGSVFRQLHSLWLERGRRDEYLGTLVNEFLARGGKARAICIGSSYVDVGTVHGYREAMRLLSEQPSSEVSLIRDAGVGKSPLPLSSYECR